MGEEEEEEVASEEEEMTKRNEIVAIRFSLDYANVDIVGTIGRRARCVQTKRRLRLFVEQNSPLKFLTRRVFCFRYFKVFTIFTRISTRTKTLRNLGDV